MVLFTFGRITKETFNSEISQDLDIDSIKILPFKELTELGRMLVYWKVGCFPYIHVQHKKFMLVIKIKW